MGYRLNRLDEPVLTDVSKPFLPEAGLCHRLESCEPFINGFGGFNWFQAAGSDKSVSFLLVVCKLQILAIAS